MLLIYIYGHLARPLDLNLKLNMSLKPTDLTWPRHKENPLPTNARKIKNTASTFVARLRELLEKSAGTGGNGSL